MAAGDATKVNYLLYEESYVNLVLYASAMPHYDDVEQENVKPTPEVPKGGAMNFSQFLDTMEAIKEQHG